MKIVIGGSMQFAEQMLDVRNQLQQLGHQVVVSKGTEKIAIADDQGKEEIKLQQKFHEDAIRYFWQLMTDAEALLILNYDKNGISNYIGGNALLDIGLAYYLRQKIFLSNPIPDIAYYKTEIEVMQPIIINGDLSKIV